MSLPSIEHYFNTVVFPRLPHLGYFSSPSSKVVCPFHDDVNPSMGIIPGTEIFNCFGCSAHGNVVALHVKCVKLFTGEDISKEEALQELCEMYDIVFTPPTPQQRADVLISAASSKPSFSVRLAKVQTPAQWSDEVLREIFSV